MDINLQDAADIELEERADDVDGDGEDTETDDVDGDGNDTETEEDEENEEPKRKRGKDREWKDLASFPNKEEFRASEIHIELSTEMTRHNKYLGKDCLNHLYVCRYYKKPGWKRCNRAVRVGFAQSSFEIFVWESEDEHKHEKEEGYATPVNYHWTPEQCQVIHRHIQSKSKRINLILRELRDENLVNGTGLLPTKLQVAFNGK